MNNDPMVTVLVTHHLNENDGYFSKCLESVRASIGVRLDFMPISDAPKYPDVSCSVVWDHKLKTCADKWEYAVRNMATDSQFFMMINDDVMISKHLIADMTRAAALNGILGPMSNCDNGSRYVAEMPFPRKLELVDLSEEGKNWALNYRGPLILLPQDWIGFYCVFMTRDILKKVGNLDPKLEVRYNDADYCRRARMLGIPSFVHLGSFGLHFGDKTIPRVTTAEQYDAADKAMSEKYPVSNR